MSAFSYNLITKDEVLLLTGIDLDTLVDDANPSNKCERFIYERQIELFSFIYKNYKNDPYLFYRKRATPEQKDHIKKAIAYQCVYVYFNGDIANDSVKASEKSSNGEFNRLRISQKAYDELTYCRELIENVVDRADWMNFYMDIELFGGY